jgi:Zn-dependent peptidase ImmA (M78 family)
MFVTSSTVKEWAHSAWRTLGLTAPVDLRRVCEHLGIEIEKMNIDLQAAGLYVEVDAETPVVSLNQYIPESSLRFTLAHEIAHHLLARAVGAQRAGSGRGSKWTERLCDKFAAELLMPEFAVREQADQLGHPRYHDKTITLAARFDVSEQAMRIRLKELGLQHSKGARLKR